MNSDLPDATTLHDVFICHASEDKDAFVRALAEALRSHHVEVWYDEFALDVGDSLREAIDRGLAASRYGIVVLSPSFFRKRWPKRELNGLVAREMAEDRGMILPVWLCLLFIHPRAQDRSTRFSCAFYLFIRVMEITDILSQNVPLEDVQYLAGHSNPSGHTDL